MAPKQVVRAEKGLKSPLLSQAIIHNGTVYVSGHVGLDTSTNQIIQGTVADRTRKAIENIKIVLEEAGSSLEKILKVSKIYGPCCFVLCLTVSGDEYLHYEHGRLCCYEQGLCAITKASSHSSDLPKTVSELIPDPKPARTCVAVAELPFKTDVSVDVSCYRADLT